MSAIPHKIDVQSSMKNVTLEVVFDVVGRRRLAARIWLARKLIALAAWVLGCGVEIDTRMAE